MGNVMLIDEESPPDLRLQAEAVVDMLYDSVAFHFNALDPIDKTKPDRTNDVKLTLYLLVERLLVGTVAWFQRYLFLQNVRKATGVVADENVLTVSDAMAAENNMARDLYARIREASNTLSEEGIRNILDILARTAELAIYAYRSALLTTADGKDGNRNTRGYYNLRVTNLTEKWVTTASGTNDDDVQKLTSESFMFSYFWTNIAQMDGYMRLGAS